MFWMQLLAILISGFLVWYLFRFVRSNPDAFSKANLGQTMYTLGWLALFLIALIGFCVLMLKS